MSESNMAERVQTLTIDINDALKRFETVDPLSELALLCLADVATYAADIVNEVTHEVKRGLNAAHGKHAPPKRQ